jgi:hypothetical protein
MNAVVASKKWLSNAFEIFAFMAILFRGEGSTLMAARGNIVQ